MQSQHHKPLLLIFPFDASAHYLRCLMLARQWSPYFQIKFAHSDRYAPFVAKEGFETVRCAALDADTVFEQARRFRFDWLREDVLHTVFRDQVQVLKEWRPLVVLGDAVPTLKMATETTGTFYVSLQNAYMSKHYGGVRSLSRTHPLYPWLLRWPQTLVDLLTQTGETLSFRRLHAPFARIRKIEGLSREQNYLDEGEGDLNLIPDLPALFPLNATPPHYRVVPPLYYTFPPNENQSLLSKKTEAAKTIFISAGSSGNWRKMDFLNHPFFHRYTLITAGDNDGVVQGPSVIRESFVNAEAVLPHTDLVICHGGNGTVYQALAHGIPVLCKTAYFEQEWNAEAVERKGLGKNLDNVHRIDDYIAATEEWITKKGKGPLAHFQKMLWQSANNADSMLHSIAQQLIEANARPAAQPASLLQ